MTAVRDMGRIIKEASQADPMGPGKWLSLPMRLKIIHLWRWW